MLQWFPVPSEYTICNLANKAFRGLVLSVTIPYLRLHTPGKMNHQELSVPPNVLHFFSALPCGLAVLSAPSSSPSLAKALSKYQLPPGH